METNNNEMEFYFQHNRFWQLFRRTRKDKDLWKSKESIGSFIIAVITVILFILVLYPEGLSKPANLTETIDLIRNVLMAVAAGLFGMFGFLVTGLAILTGTMSNK
jgi:hypothetical protein